MSIRDQQQTLPEHGGDGDLCACFTNSIARAVAAPLRRHEGALKPAPRRRRATHATDFTSAPAPTSRLTAPLCP